MRSSEFWERLPASVSAVLADAGFFPGRVAGRDAHCLIGEMVSAGFTPNPGAVEVLNEWWGIAVAQQGRGVDLGRDSFDFDPWHVVDERDIIQLDEGLAGESLFPVGTLGPGYLCMGPSGRVYLVGDVLVLLGEDLAEALVNLIEGHRGSRLR